jgi:hypothetical protein
LPICDRQKPLLPEQSNVAKTWSGTTKRFVSRFYVRFSKVRVANGLVKTGATNTMHKKKNDSEESSTGRSARVWDSVEQVIASHGLSRNSLYKLIDEGVIQSKLVCIPGSRGLGHRLVNVRSLERFIEASNTHAPARVMKTMRKLTRASVASRHVAKLARRRRVKGGK